MYSFVQLTAKELRLKTSYIELKSFDKKKKQTQSRLLQLKQNHNQFVKHNGVCVKQVPTPRLVTSTSDVTHKVLVKEEQKDKLNNTTMSVSYLYDKNGRRIKEIGANYEIEYKYIIETSIGKWNECETFLNGEPYTKTFRTFDQQGRLLNQKEYIHNILREERTFSYDQNTLGDVILSVNYDQEGKLERKEEYVWFEPYDNYLISVSTIDRREIYTVNGNSYKLVQEYFQDDIWVRQIEENRIFWEENEDYYNSCGYRIEYDIEGKIVNAYGEWVEIQENTPLNGYLTRIYNEVRRLNETEVVFSPIGKVVYTNNYYDKLTLDKPKCSIIYYSYKDGDWIFNSSNDKEWLTNNIYHTYDRYYNSDEKIYQENDFYEKYNENCKKIGDVYMLDNGSYIVEHNSKEEDKYIYYYTYYNGNEIIKQLRNVSDNENFWYEYIDGEWIKLVNETLKIQYYNDEYDEYKFDMQGRIIEYIEFEDSIINEHGYYTYTENSVVIKVYRTDLEGNEYLNSYVEAIVNVTDTNTVTTKVIYEYSENGTIYYASKVVSTDTGIDYHYEYDYENGKFLETAFYVDVQPLSKVADDGTHTIIERKLDENGHIVYTNKYEYRYNDIIGWPELRANYYWDAETSDWIGESKREFVYVSPVKFNYKQVNNGFNNEGRYESKINTFELPIKGWYNEYNYSWDTQKSDWVISSSSEVAYELQENSFTCVYKDIYDNSVNSITISYTCDKNGMLLKSESIYNDSENKEINSVSCVYDTDYMLESKTIFDEKNTEIYNDKVYTYIYEEISYSSSNVDEILINKDVPIEYFNLQGVKVTKPEKGIYIIKQGIKTTKIVL